MSRLSSPSRLVAAFALLLTACVSTAPEAPLDEAWLADWHAWRAAREATLTDPSAFLGLAGLAWLEPGSWSLGADPLSDLVMPPSCADRLGQLSVGEGRVELLASPGAVHDAGGRLVNRARLYDAATGEAPKLSAGSTTFWVIERAGRLGLRVADPSSPVLAAYDGTPTWQPLPRWRVPACFVPSDEPSELDVPNVLGSNYRETCHGKLVFDLGDQSCELLVTGRSEDTLSVIFGDASNGHGSYHGGRFLDVPIAGDGPVVMIDFNRAENPPCAYSPYTTCPLPPEGNVLPVAITAGEQAWHGRDALGSTPLPAAH